MASSSQEAPVLVVGAGMSGIATAWALRQAGIDSIVLEARDRIGGRIWSSDAWDDGTVDLGASWVTHGTVNPLVALAREKNIALKKSDLFNIAVREADGNVLTDDEITLYMTTFFATYAAVAEKAERRRKRGRPDIPLSKVFPKAIDDLKLPKREKRIVEFFLNFTGTEPYASDLKDLSLFYWDDDYTRFNLQTFIVPDGYVRIAEVLAKGLDIRLEHVVKKISYDKDGVVISTVDHGQFRAPYAVITLPHGVLAAKRVKFSPKLPAWKQASIDGLHTGLSDKFWFLFPNKFWKTNREILGRVDADGEGRWSTWLNLHHYTKQPILMCFNRNEHALALEKMSDDDVIAEAMGVLRKAYGANIPDPIDMQRSCWQADPFACGTLPHIPPGGKPENHRILGLPVGRLRFAGDSTIAEVPGTVFAAFLSGVREASKLTMLNWKSLGR